jgi:HAD superfamily hydrolase (TIGR01509 family)
MGLMILDIDGTLVDTNYHHAIAWYRAFHRHGIVIPVWHIHRNIGIGGEYLVEELTGPRVERDHGNEIRQDERDCYMEMIGEVQATHGSRELIEDLKRRAHTVLLASFAKPEEVEHYLDLLDARGLADGWTTSVDVRERRPEADLVHAALRHTGAQAQDTVMVGDSPWDVRAAQTANVQALAVMTGGFSQDELLDAGAAVVFQSVAELRGELEQTSVLRAR